MATGVRTPRRATGPRAAMGLAVFAVLVGGVTATAGDDSGGALSSNVNVNVIVRATTTDQAAADVVAVGGSVTSRLSIVSAVAATIPANQVRPLSRADGVQQVTPDGSLTVGDPALAQAAAAETAGDPSLFPADIARMDGASQGWANGITGAGVDVALLDTGVVAVPGLDAPGKLVYGPDLSFDSQSPAAYQLDAYGHGTNIAGIIAGADPGAPGQGFTGIAPGARIVSVKVGAVDGAVDVSQVIAGIDWIVQHKDDGGLHIRVLNLSFGTDSTQAVALDPLAYAADVAWQHGIVVVAAVGNDGSTNTSVADPAIDPNIIAVGAADTAGTPDPSDDQVAAFSSRGNSDRRPDLVAPGVHIVSLRDPGSYLDQAFPNAVRDNRFFRGSGTSQSAAVVSGAVALLLQQRPNLTPDQVKKILRTTADPISTTKRTYAGAGELDVLAALARKTPTTLPAPVSLSGTGSLNAARGSGQVTMGGVALTGEQDIFANPFSTSSWAPAAAAGASWSGGSWNGASWSGASWSGASWSGASWSGASWSGASWSGASWSGASWSDADWLGVRWD